MKQTPIKSRGKRSRERAKGMDAITPYLASRSGGIWLGWKVPRGEAHSDGCQCEICGAYIGDCWGHRAHIDERRGPSYDTIENIIIACGECHNHDLYADGGLKCGTERAKEIVRLKNEREGR